MHKDFMRRYISIIETMGDADAVSEAIVDAFKEKIHEGLSLREAVRYVAETFGRPRLDVAKLILWEYRTENRTVDLDGSIAKLAELSPNLGKIAQSILEDINGARVKWDQRAKLMDAFTKIVRDSADPRLWHSSIYTMTLIFRQAGLRYREGDPVIDDILSRFREFGAAISDFHESSS